MKLLLHCSHFIPTDRISRLVADTLASLRPLVRIEEARVRLEYRPEASPAYRATVHLVVPGPDFRAEAVDHTVGTALARVMRDLRAHALDRSSRRRRTVLPARHRPATAAARPAWR